MGMMQEAKRRDARVKELYAKCPYRPGDTCIPVDAEEAELYGEVRVVAIADSYSKFGKHEKWPESDNPMLVSFASAKTHETMWCTTNFLRKK
jgi:uncharacterized protein YfaT (DUF1175 family)